ncbi:hypothetical protein Q1695_014486 [Nippostrongylus brasiliensis]|nr:hypothetical protein Q1695_014486 [Nippostrongylus brasiliensis]
MGREPSSSGHLLVRTPTKTLAIVAQLFRSCLLLASAGCNGFGPNIELGQRQQKPDQECTHTNGSQLWHRDNQMDVLLTRNLLTTIAL